VVVNPPQNVTNSRESRTNSSDSNSDLKLSDRTLSQSSLKRAQNSNFLSPSVSNPNINRKKGRVSIFKNLSKNEVDTFVLAAVPNFKRFISKSVAVLPQDSHALLQFKKRRSFEAAGSVETNVMLTPQIVFNVPQGCPDAPQPSPQVADGCLAVPCSKPAQRRVSCFNKLVIDSNRSFCSISDKNEPEDTRNRQRALARPQSSTQSFDRYSLLRRSIFGKQTVVNSENNSTVLLDFNGPQEEIYLPSDNPLYCKRNSMSNAASVPKLIDTYENFEINEDNFSKY